MFLGFRRAALLVACIATASMAHIQGGPRQASALQVQAPSSYALINQALAAGRINAETAHKYRVFAAFGDTRLPAPFRGDDGGLTEMPHTVLEAGALLQTFSAQTQAELRPFFMPPGEPGSWIGLATVTGDPPPPDPESAGALAGPSAADSPRGTQPAAQQIRWHTILAAGGKVKVWAQPRHAGDSAKAEVIAREMTTTIWPRLVTLFWEPLSDLGEPYDSNGPELDIFLVRPSFTDRDSAANRRRYGMTGPWRGMAMNADPYKCSASASYLLINSENPLGSATSIGLLQDVAHEFAHAITARKPLKGTCQDYIWIREATATWAEEWAYPQAQSEQERAWRFFSDARRPLDHLPNSAEANFEAYASYIFPLHLMLSGKGRAIPAMWEKFAQLDQRPGVNEGLKTQGTTLDKVFPEFAVQNLNRWTANDYMRFDRLVESFKIRPDSFSASVAAQPVYEKDITLGMRWLSTKYAHFDFDASVKTVTFDNTLVPISWAGVWAIEKIGGSWKAPIDLTKESGKTWCRDNTGENIQELILSFTNNEWQDTTRRVDPGRNRPVIRAYPTGCTGWIGTTSMTNTIRSTDPAITIVENVNTTMRFAVDSALILAGQPIEYWKVVGGHVTWDATVSGQCTGGASGGFTITDMGPGDEIATLRVWQEGGQLHHSGSSGPWPGDIPRFTISCPNETVELALIAALGFFVTDFNRDLLAPNGRSFSGDHTSSAGPGVTTRHRYSFRCTSGC